MASLTDENHQGFEPGAADAHVLAALLIGLLLLAGSAFLYEGMGLDIEILGHGALKSYALPIGLVLWLLAVVAARSVAARNRAEGA
jgi:hypothetical protein